MKLKNIAISIAAVSAVSTSAYAVDAGTAADLHKNAIAIMNKPMDSFLQGLPGEWRGAYVFASATDVFRHGVDQFVQATASYDATGRKLNVTVGADRYEFAPNIASFVDYSSNNYSKTSTKWSDRTASVDVKLNGVVICSACDSLWGNYSINNDSREQVFVIYKDRRFGSYVVPGYNGPVTW